MNVVGRLACLRVVRLAGCGGSSQDRLETADGRRIAVLLGLDDSDDHSIVTTTKE